MEHTKKMSLALISVVSLVYGIVGGGLSGYAVFSILDNGEETTGDTIINFENGSYKEVWEKAAPAVVSVVALKDLGDYYDQFSFFGFPKTVQEDGELSEVSSGTGFILTADGLVVTNKHVVSDAEAEYVVILDDGTELEAEVLDKDSLNDIALVQITGDDDRIGEFPNLDFADSDLISVGDPVVAIGNALGEYSNTTTAGIISATGREILAGGTGFGTETLVNLIQTDAAINPGNSGGPLLNLSGEIVGMNTAVDTTASGIGFAIPSNDIAMVVKSYQEFGRIVRPFVGVRYVVVHENNMKRLGVDVDYGVYVIGDQQAQLPGVVQDSPAAKAGVKEGDVILSVNGEVLTETKTLVNVIAGYLVGETITLEIWRDGETITATVTLEESIQ